MAGFFNTNWDIGNSFNSPYGSNQQQQNIFGTNPMDQGRYVGNPNHSNMPPRGVISNTGMVNPQYNLYNQPTDMGGGNAFSGNTTGGSGTAEFARQGLELQRRKADPNDPIYGVNARKSPGQIPKGAARPTYARPPSELMNPNSPTYKPGLEEQWLERNGGNPQIGDNGFTQALPRPGVQPPVNLWGAPTGYDPSQQQNIFNPYSLGNNQYYNPYSFGGINTGTQDGTGEVPWWQNYNTGGTGVTPPTVTPPTTPTQPTGNGGGGGRQGKDLTYAETIKEMGLYPNAEKAFEAGDNQAAYRQDHMQWRSGTGAWAGNGKKAGESDGDYPGRTVGNNVIKGDKQRMAELMGLGNLFMGNGNGMLKRTPNDRGGNDYTVAGDGTFVTPGGTTVETQLTRDSNLAAQEAFQGFNSDMLRKGNRLPFGENTNIFGPAAPNGEQLSQTMVAQDDSGMFSISDIPNSYSNIRGGDRSGPAPTIQPAPTTQYEAGPAETRYGVNNSRELIESNLFGVNKPTAVEDAYNQRRFLSMRQESEKQAAMAESKRAAEKYEAQNRARETAQVQARADRAAQDRQDAARRAQAQAQDKAQKQAKAAADAKRAKEAANAAAAARQRQNNKYSTGPVAPRPSTGTGGSSSGRGGRKGRTTPKAKPKKTTTTRRYTGRYGL